MTRKIVIICIVLTVLNGQLYAQQNTASIEKTEYAAKVEKYRKMKSGGTVLTVIGSVLVVVGMVTIVTSMYETDDTETTNGAICALLGYGSLGAGIPLWIVGGVQHKKYSAKFQQVSVKINATPQSHGLTLTYRF